MVEQPFDLMDIFPLFFRGWKALENLNIINQIKFDVYVCHPLAKLTVYFETFISNIKIRSVDDIYDNTKVVFNS